MNKHNVCTAITAAAGLLVLILDGKTALAGAAEGISICLNVLIPSLFPFFLLSMLLTGALSGQSITFLRPAAKLCRIPEGTESLLAIGLLGGYPVGAQNVAMMHRAGQLSDGQAARMITFCNNAGPAFIFGILGNMFSTAAAPWLLWAIHLISALITGALMPARQGEKAVRPSASRLRLTDVLPQAVHVMGLVCGWVVLMRMVLTFLQRWFLWLLPLPVQIALSGILELSNGCIQLSEISHEGLRFIIASALLALGGICITLQTASVTQGISMRLYFPGKLLQSATSVLLAGAVQLTFPASMRCNCIPILPICAVLALGCILTLQYSKKSSGIPAIIGV